MIFTVTSFYFYSHILIFSLPILESMVPNSLSDFKTYYKL